MTQPTQQPELTDKQRAFVLEYVKDWNGIQAAIRAGYSVDSAAEIAHENLRKPKIRSKIDRHFESLGITWDHILAERAAIAFADIGDFVEIPDGGGGVFNGSDRLKGKTKIIKKIKEKRRIISSAEGDGKEMVIDSQLEIELYDRQKSLEVLGKHVSGRERINPPEIEGYTPDSNKPPAQQLVDLLAFTVNQSQQGRLDPKLASSIASLASALLKANEQGELEERIKKLEGLQAGQTAPDDLGLGFND